MPNETRNRVDRARAAARRQGLYLTKSGEGFILGELMRPATRSMIDFRRIILGVEQGERMRFHTASIADIEQWLAEAAS